MPVIVTGSKVFRVMGIDFDEEGRCPHGCFWMPDSFCSLCLPKCKGCGKALLNAEDLFCLFCSHRNDRHNELINDLCPSCGGALDVDLYCAECHETAGEGEDAGLSEG